MKEVLNMSDKKNEKNYFLLEKEYRSKLKELNNTQNKIIAGAVVIFSISPLFLSFFKIDIVIILIMTIAYSFIGYRFFEPFYDKPLINALKNEVNKIFEGENKIENLINFEKYLEEKINEKISILDLTPGQAIASSFIFCFINVIDKSFNDNGFCLNIEAITIYSSIFILSMYLIIFFDSYRKAYRKNTLTKKLIKIIDNMITDEYRNNN